MRWELIIPLIVLAAIIIGLCRADWGGAKNDKPRIPERDVPPGSSMGE